MSKILGQCIGDDGLFMTEARRRTHRLFNIVGVVGVLVLISTIVFAVLAYMQGQIFTDWNLIAQGGNEYRGYPVANLLRIQAGICFVCGLFFIALYITGFSWLYDNGSSTPSFALIVIILVIQLVWFLFLLSIEVFNLYAAAIMVLCVASLLIIKQAQTEKATVDLSV